MNNSTKLIIISVFVFVIILLLFPLFSQSNGPSKYIDPKITIERTSARVRFADPIRAAMRHGDVNKVKELWMGLQAYSSTTRSRVGEDPMLRLEIARFLISRGDKAGAREHLDKILHPPRGFSSTLESDGEVMALWLQVNPTGTIKVEDLQAWKVRKLSTLGQLGKKFADVSPEALAEWSTAQGLMVASKNAEALVHYERAAQLAPQCETMQLELANGHRSNGNYEGYKLAIRKAYFAADPKDRPEMLVRYGLKRSDIKPINP